MVARFDSERRWFFSCLDHPDTTLPAPGRPSEIKKAEIGCVFCHCATQDLPKPTLPKPMPLFVSEKHPAANSQADYDKTTGDHLRRWKSSRGPRRWVEQRHGEWNHGDWTTLLAELFRSSYWPMNEAAIGQTLEREKQRYWRQKNTAR